MRRTPTACELRMIGAGVLLGACATEPAGISRQMPPEIASAIVAADEHNTLSAIVAVRVSRADSVAVRFNLRDESAAAASVTPAVLVTGDSANVPVLGLLPESRSRLPDLVGREAEEGWFAEIRTNRPFC